MSDADYTPEAIGPVYQYPSHLRPAMNREERRETVEACIQKLRQYEFDTLAFSGISGVSIGFILAQLMDKEVISVRQPGVRRRAGSQYNEEGYRHALKYVIIDDLISTGTTAARVIRGVRKIAPQAELVGILVYYNCVQLVRPPTPFDDKHSYEWTNVSRVLREMDYAELEGKHPEIK
jgi:adenine/guanine phosphoribosyltransferase-like PRPP-binding protein